MNLKLVILCITLILLLIPIAGATYDVVSGIASNSTEYTTSASYTELHNLSLATGTGTVFIKASWDARLNFTAPLYGRFVRDGVSLGRFNLTQSVYAQVGSYELALNETTGTHYYGWEVYSNKKGTIYSRNFSAVFLANGTYGADLTSSISALQVNDSYFNGTVFPNSTNFRNDFISGKLDISTYSGNFPNSSLVNYLLTATYNGNYPNYTVAANLANWNSTYNSSYNALLTNAPNTTVANNLANWNATYNASYAIGGGAISFSNGTNNISIGSKKKKRMATAGTITALYVNQTNDDACSGNLTVSSSGTNKAYIAWSGVANASSTGLTATFTQGEWLMYNMTENTGCKDLTFEQVHTKS